MKADIKKKEFDQAEEKLADLMFFGLDYGIENLHADSAGTLIPIVVTEKEGERDLKRFVTERMEEGLKKGEQFLMNEKEARYGIVIYDGYLTVDGNKVDAVLVKGFDRQDEVGYIIGQRYSRKKDNTELEVIGNPAFIGNEEQMLK
ncbi:hypothetical protein [Nibribacter koreensis]|uniref:Uncharacterized protein n=1 Tax=Nibribacter koreensis TaxID=1084519 RepID=A0ABP8FAH9_9BACT